MVTNLGYFISYATYGITSDQSNPKSGGYFDRPFMQIYNQGCYFYPENKFQEVSEKKYKCSSYLLAAGMQKASH